MRGRDQRSSRGSRYLQARTWLVYGVLLVLAVPWYWPADSTLLLLGMPAWVVTSVFVSLVISIYTAWLLLSHWPLPDDPFCDPDDNTDESTGEQL
ncbi:MAG TPA: hypothetical protein EYG16_10075 [Deltaproteobacteria bacterium]|nr:hypothetical protein [Deltaproteobacteria bacterium]